MKTQRFRDRRGETLFIDARNLGQMISRTQRELTKEEIKQIATTYHAWRGEKNSPRYEDTPGFCKATKLEDIAEQNYVLTPGRYVGFDRSDEDGESAHIKLAQLTSILTTQFDEAHALEQRIRINLKRLGHGN